MQLDRIHISLSHHHDKTNSHHDDSNHHSLRRSFEKIGEMFEAKAECEKIKISRKSSLGNLISKFSPIDTIFSEEGMASHKFEEIKERNSKKELYEFIHQFPKGGDTHCHLTGAIDTCDYIKLAQEKNLRFTLDNQNNKNPSFMFYKSDEIEELSSQSSADFSSNSRLKKDFMNVATTRKGNDFFETFPNFESIDRYLALSDYLLPLLKNAHKANTLYLEVSKGFESHFKDWDKLIQRFFINMFPDPNSSGEEVYKKKLKDVDLEVLYEFLLIQLQDKKNEYLAYLDEAEKYIIPEDLEKKGFKKSLFSLSNPVVVRLNGDVNRELPLPEFFADLTLSFLLVDEEINLKKNNARLLGVVLSGREFLKQSLFHLKTHLKMIHFLRTKFPRVNCSIHTGELSNKNVLPDQIHKPIYQVLKYADSPKLEQKMSSITRLGHGTCITHDKKALDILKEKATCIEICPTSSETILDIKKQEHPLGLLLKFKIPITINTDDPGVLRTNLTNEFIKAVNWYPKEMTYYTLKDLARNQIRYSFLPGEEIYKEKYPSQYKLLSCFRNFDKQLKEEAKILLKNSPKASLQYRLEKRFMRFELKFKDLNKRLASNLELESALSDVESEPLVSNSTVESEAGSQFFFEEVKKNHLLTDLQW